MSKPSTASVRDRCIDFVHEHVYANPGKSWSEVRAIIMDGGETWIKKTAGKLQVKGAETRLRKEFGEVMDQADAEHVAIEQAKRRGATV
jgi:hypothetical protein